VQISSKSSAIKDLYTQKLTSDEVKEIRKEIQQNINKFATYQTRNDTNLTNRDKNVDSIVDNFQHFLKFLEGIGYDGNKSFSKLSKEEGDSMLKDMFKSGYKELDTKV